VRGGVKIYRGSARAARDYVEADRSRADDYYLAEGTGVARRYTATGGGVVARLADLGGDGYQRWVAGVDPDTGQMRGRVRADERAVRFAEVVVNGPKSWSIAAELHPDVAAAYEAAQDRAAEQIVAWLGQHATTRVGPRGGQVATGVERLEAVSVRHYTSRAGDPHRHLHVQVNARVWAAGKWRGLDTVAVRDSIAAVHGIGHAAVLADQGFRGALAAHGFTLDADTGEVVQLSGFVAAFSKRAGQVAAQVAGYETEWRAAHPGEVPGPALWRSWDARAWATDRPGKAKVETAGRAHGRWLGELHTLGYTAPPGPVRLEGVPVGRINRDAAAVEVLTRLGAARSAWNQADLRGEVEQLIARAGVVADPAVRAGLAEDVTARAATGCVALLDRDIPEHVRGWSSPAVIAAEADLSGRLAVRGAIGARDASPEQVAAAAAAVGAVLDPAQEQAAAALAGDHPLVLITGAAGAGKTTTLATARTALEQDGHQLVVVTPTLKAARTARAETGARAGSAAWLAHQHGWRWDPAGAWSRLQPGQVDPGGGRAYTGPTGGAVLTAGDLLVVDEAGMADQDTARALLTIADQHGVRVGLVGDPHQLAAVGRGGVLDLAQRWAERTVTLDVIHRFTRTAEIAPGITGTVPDVDYADLSLRMRAGADPGAVFDRLAERGQVALYPDEATRLAAVAEAAAQARAVGVATAVAVATREQAAGLNTAIRDRLVELGLVDDTITALAAGGQPVGVGDLVATRRNDRTADVANRDTWTVTAVDADGGLSITGPAGPRTLTPAYVAGHVELAYASTVHGVQGDTAQTGHLLLDEHTGAGAAYVGMTRGRTVNTAHLIADTLLDARARWIDAAGRGRADLGLDAARQAAQRAAAPYTPTPAPTRLDDDADARLAGLLDRLRVAWTAQAQAQALLERLGPRLEHATADAGRRQQTEKALAPLRQHADTARAAAETAGQAAEESQHALTGQAAQIAQVLHADWETDRPAAAEAARIVQVDPGRLGRLLHRRDIGDAKARLAQWASKWQPIHPDLPPSGDIAAVAAYAARPPHAGRTAQVITAYAGRQAAAGLPQHAARTRTARQAEQAAQQAQTAYTQAAGRAGRLQTIRDAAAAHRDLANDLPALTAQTASAQARLDAATRRVADLTADPALTTRPDAAAILTGAQTSWTHHRAARQAAQAARQADQATQARRPDPGGPAYPAPYRHRGGPSLGR